MQRSILANLALAYTKAGRYEEAMSAAKQAITISPAWDKAHYRLGMALVEAKRCPEAVAPLKQACLLSKGKHGQSNQSQLDTAKLQSSCCAHHHQALLSKEQARESR